MSSSGLFTPSGGVNSTTNVAVTTASQTFTLPTQTNLDDTLLLSNAGTAMVFWSFGNVTASQVTCQPLNPNPEKSTSEYGVPEGTKEPGEVISRSFSKTCLSFVAINPPSPTESVFFLCKDINETRPKLPTGCPKHSEK